MLQDTHAQELTESNCTSRSMRSKLLRKKFSNFAVEFIFLSDEKLFTVAPSMNSQNDRVSLSCALVGVW